MEELLKKLGYTDEQITAILDGMKESGIHTSSEEYIDERYSKLKGQHDEAASKLTAAEDLIKQLQPQAAGNEALQTKIGEYEAAVKDAEERAAKAERDAAIKVELLAKGAKADDVDYLMYRLESDDVEVKVGSDGKLSGMDDAVKALKTAHPAQFKAEDSKSFLDNPLPRGDGGEKDEPKSLADALAKNYEKN